MSKINHRKPNQLPELKQDMSRIFRITLPEKTILEHPGMVGFGYRNITMLVESNNGMATVSFAHPNRMPTFEEIRVLTDKLMPNKNFMIPLNLHTLRSHMVTAIEFPPEAVPARAAEEDPQPEEVKP